MTTNMFEIIERIFPIVSSYRKPSIYYDIVKAYLSLFTIHRVNPPFLSAFNYLPYKKILRFDLPTQFAVENNVCVLSTPITIQIFVCHGQLYKMGVTFRSVYLNLNQLHHISNIFHIPTWIAISSWALDKSTIQQTFIRNKKNQTHR